MAGEATLITALQCVTQTTNNQPGALSARTIKALCEVLHGDPRRDSGLALLEAFDSIDLMAIQDASAVDAAAKKVGRVQAMADRIHKELGRLLPQKTCTQKTAGREASGDDRNVFHPIGHTAPAKVARQIRKRAGTSWARSCVRSPDLARAYSACRASEVLLGIPPCDETHYRVGLGVEGRVNGYYLHVGSERFSRGSGDRRRAATDFGAHRRCARHSIGWIGLLKGRGAWQPRHGSRGAATPLTA
jgi:hypothetical protein